MNPLDRFNPNAPVERVGEPYETERGDLILRVQDGQRGGRLLRGYFIIETVKYLCGEEDDYCVYCCRSNGPYGADGRGVGRVGFDCCCCGSN